MTIAWPHRFLFFAFQSYLDSLFLIDAVKTLCQTATYKRAL